MRCVIQCAGSKREAGTFIARDGRRVVFVARADEAPSLRGILHVHPDDPSDRDGRSWRERIVMINEGREDDPGLLQAGRLYRPAAYQHLLDWLGPERLFVLSAGWGLVRASFLLPDYDITFSTSADSWKRRRSADAFSDFDALNGGADEDTLFLGGKDYLPLFLRLTQGTVGRRVIAYNSGSPPTAPGCVVTRYPTTQRTNWHYACAEDLVAGTWKPAIDAIPL